MTLIAHHSTSYDVPEGKLPSSSKVRPHAELGSNSPNHLARYVVGRYLNDFSKALAGEVRVLLAEVGKLRDERRQLQ